MIPTSTRLSYANGYIELGLTKEAAAELDEICEADRLQDDVLSMRAKLYLETNNWEVLAAVSEQLATQSPEIPHAWVHWAYALRELNRNAEAKSVALRGLKHHPQEAVLHFNLACYCSLLDQLPEASKYLDAAIKLDKTFKEEAKTDPDLAKLQAWLKETS
ncbi:tetratricopeptide repeat domain protein [Verrucomicrobiia bacterium DG1235]|nr:tetratricopeptide repeat domain protein [Verrucomicrobiae bacterium DG1235]